MNFILKLFGKVMAFFATPAGGLVKDAVASLLERSQNEVLDLLFNEAKTRVELLNNVRPGATGEMKNEDVKAYLQKFLADKGLEVGQSVINFAIESAVQALKK